MFGNIHLQPPPSSSSLLRSEVLPGRPRPVDMIALVKSSTVNAGSGDENSTKMEGPTRGGAVNPLLVELVELLNLGIQPTLWMYKFQEILEKKQNLLIIWRAYDSDTLQYSVGKWQGHSKYWFLSHDFIQTLNQHLHLVHFATLIVALGKIAWLSYGHGEKHPNVGKFNFKAGKKSLPILLLFLGKR